MFLQPSQHNYDAVMDFALGQPWLPMGEMGALNLFSEKNGQVIRFPLAYMAYPGVVQSVVETMPRYEAKASSVRGIHYLANAKTKMTWTPRDCSVQGKAMPLDYCLFWVNHKDQVLQEYSEVRASVGN